MIKYKIHHGEIKRRMAENSAKQGTGFFFANKQYPTQLFSYKISAQEIAQINSHSKNTESPTNHP